MRPEKLAPPEMYEGDVAATIDFGWDGIKLDSCGAEKDLNLFERLLNATGKPIMIENWYGVRSHVSCLVRQVGLLDHRG